MRPHVICHMCTTIDGRIRVDRWPKSARASNLFERTAATFKVGAWLVGTTTMKEFAESNVKLGPPNVRIGKGDHVAQPKAKRLAIGVDANGVLRYSKGEIDGDHVVLLVSEKVSAAYLAHLQKAGVSYLLCGRAEVHLPTALTKLAKAFNLRKLMLEGGGTFNGAMLQAGLVDEVSQVVLPIVDGGRDIRGLFDVPGPSPSKAIATLRLKSHKKLPGGAHWSRYDVLR